MLTSEQIRGARALLRLEQTELAEKSGVSIATIKRLETKPGVLVANASTVAAIRQALEKAGAIFVQENGEGPGVRLRKRRVPAPDEMVLLQWSTMAAGGAPVAMMKAHDLRAPMRKAVAKVMSLDPIAQLTAIIHNDQGTSIEFTEIQGIYLDMKNAGIVVEGNKGVPGAKLRKGKR